MNHQLYVSVDNKNTQHLTLEVLQFIHQILGNIQSKKINIRVYPVSPNALKNENVVNAMQERGIKGLPALCIGNESVIGIGDIKRRYDQLLKKTAFQNNVKQNNEPTTMDEFHLQILSAGDEEGIETESDKLSRAIDNNKRQMVAKKRGGKDKKK